MTDQEEHSLIEGNVNLVPIRGKNQIQEEPDADRPPAADSRVPAANLSEPACGGPAIDGPDRQEEKEASESASLVGGTSSRAKKQSRRAARSSSNNGSSASS
jgi:hypothetical protein